MSFKCEACNSPLVTGSTGMFCPDRDCTNWAVDVPVSVTTFGVCALCCKTRDTAKLHTLTQVERALTNRILHSINASPLRHSHICKDDFECDRGVRERLAAIGRLDESPGKQGT